MNLTKDSLGVLAFLHWNHPWNHYHFNDEILPRALDQLKELGIGFIRVDILWSDVDRGPYHYDFIHYEKLIRGIRDRGINILAVLNYNKGDPANRKQDWNSPPESFEEFAAYVGATVDHFKDRIHHWEIWNEPNLSIYWNAPKDDLQSYCALLKLSRAAALKADPRCIVMNGGLTEPVIQDVKNFYRQGGGRLSDVINIHTFLNPSDSNSENKFDEIMTGLDEVMKQHGDSQKKIWITEMGCPGLPSEKMNLTWFGGKAIDEKGQAEWVEKQIRMAKKYPRIEKLFWAFYRDTENEFKDATDYFGLVRLDLSPKPAFFRMKEILNG